MLVRGAINMGTWSVESFGNDNACDWAAQLEGCDDLSVVEAALQAVSAAAGDYLDAPTAEEGVAAAEVVARLHAGGGKRDAYSKAVDTWVRGMRVKPTPALVGAARAALDRVIAAPSELLEMYTEAGEADAWLASVANLRSRLPPAEPA